MTENQFWAEYHELTDDQQSYCEAEIARLRVHNYDNIDTNWQEILDDAKRLYPGAGLMTNERNTPKFDLWRETVWFINGFGENFTHPTGLTVNQCLSESTNLARLVYTGYGAPEGETQADRDAELEGCINKEDLDILVEFYKGLTEKIDELKRLVAE